VTPNKLSHWNQDTPIKPGIIPKTTTPTFMKDFSYYSNTDLKVLAPLKANFTTYYVYNNGVVIFSGTKTEYEEFNKNSITYSRALVQKVVDEEKYKEALRLYRSTVAEREEEFKKDLFVEFGVEDNPKREQCYEIAYNMGKSNGFSEVYCCFDEIVGLIK